MPIWPNQSDMNKFYGNPDKNRDGKADLDWENANIIKIIPPYTLYYPTELIESVNGKRKVTLLKRAKRMTGLRVHKKCADSLITCLAEIGNTFTPEEMTKYELDLCGGVFNFRLMRNGRSLSIHSWGGAIDLSHLINYYGRKYDPKLNMMPLKVVDIFKKEGWTWGGKWRTGDAMHFQAANI